MADAVCLSRHQCVVTGLISPSVLQPLMTTSTVELLSQSGYCYYYWKCQDYSAAITQLRGHCTKSRSKAVAQLNADVCWPSEWTAQSQPYDWRKRRDCQKWETGPSLWWQTIPCLRCSHRKGAVAKGTRRVNGYCSVVVSAELRQQRATISDVRQVCNVGDRQKECSDKHRDSAIALSPHFVGLIICWASVLVRDVYSVSPFNEVIIFSGKSHCCNSTALLPMSSLNCC